MIKNILRNCVTCFRSNPKAFINPQMGNLPVDLLSPYKPFPVVDVDFAGPFNLKDGKTRNRKIIKTYLCIFICFVTKAVHLELAGDLTAEGF